ncbi:MAG: 16S rRNA (cytosine(1402)-N(4))-methyltransferase RsmH [Bdellovibrionales bacterium]|nr:16S rRNA (cytosine(1402)-N(4))-methyltransferase RsmH [Bdellovibrionales bacterium]
MTADATVHVPVLLSEVIRALKPETGGRFLDCTLGGAGHTEAILKSSPDTQVVAIDRDRRALERAELRLAPYKGRFELHHLAFSELPEVESKGPFKGILADLGISSDQLEEARGLSFREEHPLDMRMNEEDSMTAEDIVNSYSAGQLTGMLRRGGVTRNMKRYVEAIVKGRPFESAQELGEAISNATPIRDRKERHPATVVFQAIRIEVNSELREIEVLLDLVPRLIAPSGVFACICFHSLEDQVVTKRMRKWKGAGAPANFPGAEAHAEQSLGKLLTRDAITPSAEEVKANPRSRSALLRVFEFHGAVNN